MSENINKDYCPDMVKRMYPDIERQVMPIITKKAKWYSSNGQLELDEAIQQGRIAIMRALKNYDYNKGKRGLTGYVNRVLDRAFIDMLNKRKRMSQMPRAVYFDCDKGEWLRKPMAPLSLDESGTWAQAEPEPDPVELDERDQLLRAYKMKITNIIDKAGNPVISARGRLVFQCLVYPQDDFLKMIENEGGDPEEAPSIHQIARYINCDKNVVDFEFTKIRELGTLLAEDNEFSDLFGSMVRSKGWPMVHLSENTKEHDQAFIRETIARRKLDPRPLPDYSTRKDHLQKLGDCWRLIERYPWGMVMVLKRGEECRTMVIEGKVNVLYGLIYGDRGQRKHIPVEWYASLAKKLNGVKE